MSSEPGARVLVTGFGPFGEHKINVSWLVAKHLPSLNLEKDGVDLNIEEIPVIYSTVSKKVPLLWKKYEPRIVIHMGVSNSKTEICLESLAHKSGYSKEDIVGKLPEKGSAVGEKDILKTTLNIQDVCDKLKNSTAHKIPVKTSTNAGRYLCEFTYYTSLNIDNTKTVFVHVPKGDNFTVKEIALVIKDIILLLLKQKPNQVEQEENVICVTE